jgi:predicted ArsR family transcriptional regulator
LSLNGEEAILTYLKKRGPATIKQIARNLILSRTRVVRVLDRLVSFNTVERIYDGDVEKFKSK